MDCPLCQRANITLYRGPNPRLRQCRCGALFAFRFRPVWPLPPRLALSRLEPIRRPRSPAVYYAYVAFLRMVFSRLRHGSRLDAVADDVRAAVPLCDRVRFWDEGTEQRHREQIDQPSAELLRMLVDQAANPAIELPDLRDLTQFHAICDFASWGLTKIADGQMAEDAAQDFGYFLHNFPEGEGFTCADAEAQAAYRQAIAGELPTARRAEIRRLWRRSL